jgi:hypothetical protein
MHVVETFNDLRAFIRRRGRPAGIARLARPARTGLAGHCDVERLDRVDIESFGTLRGPVTASHMKLFEPK